MIDVQMMSQIVGWVRRKENSGFINQLKKDKILKASQILPFLQPKIKIFCVAFVIMYANLEPIHILSSTSLHGTFGSLISNSKTESVVVN